MRLPPLRQGHPPRSPRAVFDSPCPLSSCMRIGVAVGAISVAKAISDDLGAIAEAFPAMTGTALELGMHSLQGVVRQSSMVERLDVEGLGHVTYVAFASWLREPELTGMRIGVTTCAFAWSAPVSCSTATHAVIRRRTMTRVARCLGMGAGQRPGAVVDLGRVPPARRMAARTASFRHLPRELVPVRVFVTIGALPGLHAQVVSWPLGSVTCATRNRLVLSLEWKIRALVLRDGKEGGPEAVLVMAGRAVRGTKLASMYVTVAVGA